MSTLEDYAIRNQIAIERYKAGRIKQFAKFLREISKSLRQRLVDGELTEYSRARLEKLLVETNSTLKLVFDQHYEELTQELLEFGEIQASGESAMLSVLGKADATEVAQDRLSAAIFSAPLSVRGADGGKLLKPFLDDWSRNERKRITGAIRQGYFEGQTNTEIMRALRGTRARKYKDGILDVTRRSAEAIVRTAVQHVAISARVESLQNNSLNKYQWSSTLDTRTTTQCQALDGREFEHGKGPLPPIHINCRSSIVPVLPEKWKHLADGGTRESMNGPVDGKLTYYEWLKTQPKDVQELALGKTRAAIFSKGGLSADEFARLNLGRNFKPLTLSELKVRAPIAYGKGVASMPLTKKAVKTKIGSGADSKAMVNWLGEGEYRRVVGELDKPRVKKAAEKYNLTQPEQAAIWQYSKSGHGEVNNHLWGKKTVTDSAVIKPVTDLLRRGLSKLPASPGVSYRRTDLPEDVLEKHQIGSVVEYEAFTSSSYSKEVFSGNHRLVITGKTGKRIEDLSYFNRSEREVLFTSPTKFFVTDRFRLDNGDTEIRLLEVDDD